MNTQVNTLLSLAFRVVALGTAALTLVMFALKLFTPTLYVTFLAIGLFCLAIATIADRPMPS